MCDGRMPGASAEEPGSGTDLGRRRKGLGRPDGLWGEGLGPSGPYSVGDDHNLGDLVMSTTAARPRTPVAASGINAVTMASDRPMFCSMMWRLRRA